MLKLQTKVLLGLLLIATTLLGQDISINFCPVTKIQAGKQWNATISIRNNTGQVLNFKNGTLKFDWQNLESMPYPFTSWNKTGGDVSFSVEGVGDWQSNLAAGATWTKQFNGGKFSATLNFPTSGTFTYNGTDYTIDVQHCAKTEPYELYDASVKFDRKCFIYSPNKICLGEGATEIWKGEGVYDAMVPTDRPSWAIGAMVAHRLFTNMAGIDMLSPNFWFATAMNESRMTCDNTIVPNQNSHCYINSGTNACQTGSPGNMGGTVTPNCFQVLNIGYTQISNNQPDLFAQTNAYGTASYSTIVGGDQWETGAIAVAYYHYQDIRYWNQIFCFNTNKFYKDAVDPYAVEKVFYHAYHDGPNAGISLLKDIEANYAAATAATNMNTVINTGGTWSSTVMGSQKVGNFTSLLDGNGVIYPTQKTDATTKYYGCYNAAIKWTDITYYLDKIKLLYPHVMTAAVQADIKAVFDGLNGGNPVNFEDLGPVIDEIVIQMGGHDPSGYLATQYAASKTCPGNPLGVSLRVNDTICPGETANLEVWLAGDPNYKVRIKFPDGSINEYANISNSPYTIPVTQPGDYEIVHFEDADEIGDVNCNFAKVTVESKNGSVIGWDKSNVDASTGCASGDLIITKTGSEALTISYTLDGVAQTDINMAANETTKTIASNVNGNAEYIITNMSPNSCGTPINDTIKFCGSCTSPTSAIADKGATAFCEGDSVELEVTLTGAQPWSIKVNDGTSTTMHTGITASPYSFYVKAGGTYSIDSVFDANTCPDKGDGSSVVVTMNTNPKPDLGNDTSYCAGGNVLLDAGSYASWQWSDASTATTQTVNATAAGQYIVEVTDNNGCKGKDTVNVTENANPKPNLGNDTSYCAGASVNLDAGAFVSWQWSDASTATTQTVTANSAGQYIVEVTDNNGCKGKDTVNVAENANPKPNLGNDTTICDGQSVTFDAGAFDSWQWSDASTATTQTVNATTAGQYIVEVTDNNGCTGKDTVNLAVNQNPSVNLGNDTSACKGPFNLDASKTPVVGQTYLWSDNTNGSTISVNDNGTNTYWVIVSVGNCKDTDSITITLDTALSVNIGNDTTICDYNAPLTLNGPAAMTSYQWRNLTAGTTLGTGATENASTTGDYEVFVEDASGCKGRDTINVTVNAAPVREAWTTDTLTTCAVSLPLNLDAGAVAGATYLWSDNTANQTTNANAQGDYWVKWTVNGCSDSDSVYVKVGTSLTIDLGSDIDICVGAQANFDSKFSGVGATYNWYENDGVSVGNAKTYTTAPGFTGEVKVTVSDANGCTGSDSVNVNIVNPLVIDLGNDVNICSDQTSNVDVQLIPARTGLNYNWSTGSTDSTISVLPSATTKYVLTVDSAGCSYKDSMQIVVNTIPTVTLPNDTFLCVGAGQSIPLDAGAGFAGYQWSDASTATTQNINVTAAGKYVVTVTDGNGCTNKDSITVTEQNATAFNLGNDTTICPAGTKNINVPGAVSGFTYTWHDNTNVDPFVVSNEPDGSSHQVILTVTNNFGCVSKDTVVIDVQNNLPITLGDSTICEGEDITFNSGYAGGGNFTFAWNGDATNNGNTFTITNAAAAGVQAISLAIANTVEGCSGTANVNLTVNAKPDPTLSANPICEGDSVELDPGVVGATNVEWTYGANTVTNPTLWVKVSGTYAVEVTGANGCKDTASIKLDVAPVPSPTITWLDSLCTSRIVKLYSGYTDETRYSFEWSGKPKAPLDSNYAYMDVQGNYAVKVTDKLTGCSGEVQKFLTPYRTPILDANDSMSFCENQTLELKEWRGGQPSDIVYKWENLTTNEFISTNEVITVDKAGLYRLSADNHGCTDSDTVIVTAIPVPQSGLRGDTTVCFEYLDRGMKLDAGSGDGYAYKWTPNGETDQIITITTRGTYSVTITAAGCETTDRVTVKNDCPFGVWMPSAFTPNDDGVNDTWEIKGTGIQSVEVLVFNRWGELIWKGNSIGEFWDGKYMNNLVQTDVYVYKLDYSYEDVDMILHTKTVIGRVTVLR